MFRRKRKRREWAPPPRDPAEGERARAAVRDALDRLDRAVARGPEVEERSRTLEKIRTENHLGPSFARAFGLHS